MIGFPSPSRTCRLPSLYFSRCRLCHPAAALRSTPSCPPLVGRLAATYTDSCGSSLRGTKGTLNPFLHAAAAGTDSPRQRPFLCPQRTTYCTAAQALGVSLVSMSSRLFDSRRYHRRLSVSMPDHTAEELHGLAATAGIPVAAVIREALRRALPAIRREIQRKRRRPHHGRRQMSAPAATGCYVGLREATGAAVTRPDGSPLELAPSLAVWRHSPTGFEWGFSGSGPAQLALALLLDHSGDRVIGPTPLPALQGRRRGPLARQGMDAGAARDRRLAGGDRRMSASIEGALTGPWRPPTIGTPASSTPVATE